MTSGAARMWIVTFTDLSALLLSFFVLAWAMSSPDPEAWRRIAAADGDAATAGPGLAASNRPALSSADAGPEGSVRADYLVAVLDRDLADAGRPCSIAARMREGRAELRFRPPPWGAEAPVCTRALAQAVRIFRRVAAGRREALTLVWPAPAGAGAEAALETAVSAARWLDAVAGFRPAAVVPLTPTTEPVAMLRVAPL